MFKRREKLFPVVVGILFSFYLLFEYGIISAVPHPFVQESWLTEDSAAVALQPGDKSGWTKYASKDADLQTGSDLRLAETPDSHTDTTVTDFSTGADVSGGGAVYGKSDGGNIRLVRQANNSNNVITVKSGGNAASLTLANNAVLKLDHRELPHIIFRQIEGMQHIRYTRFDGSSWTSPATLRSHGTAMKLPSLAIDVLGRVHTVYAEGGSSNKMFYARCDPNNSDCTKSLGVAGSGWTESQIWPSVAASGDFAPALEVSANGIIHLVFADIGANTGLRYMRCDRNLGDCSSVGSSAGQWSSPITLPGSLDAFANYIQTDFSNNPRVLTVVNGGTGEKGDLQLWWCNSTCTQATSWFSKWVDQSIDSSTRFVHGFKIDSSGKLFISYHQPTGSKLQYKECTISGSSAACGSTPALIEDEGATTGRFSDLAISSSGKPHIVYRLGPSGSPTVWYTRCTGTCTVSSGWNQTGTKAGEQYSGLPPDDTIDLIFDRNDNPHVLFINDSDRTYTYLTTKYQSSGTFTSGAKDFESTGIIWKDVTWNAKTPGGTSIAVHVRTSNNSAMTGAPAWSSSCKISSGVDISSNPCVTDGHRYIQYQIVLSGNGADLSPTVDSITFNYSYVPTSASLISSPYDTSNPDTGIIKLSWDEVSLPAGTYAKFQIKSASIQAGLADALFVGPDNTPGTYFQSSDTGNCPLALRAGVNIVCNLHPSFSRDSNDRWFQYKVILESPTGAGLPVVDKISVVYAINTAPMVTISSASQDATGNVNVSYAVADDDQTSLNVSLLYDAGIKLSGDLTNNCTDTSISISGDNVALLPNSGTIQIDNEQMTYSSRVAGTLSVDPGSSLRCANNTRGDAHTSGATAWVKAAAAAGDVGAVTGITPVPQSKTITWLARTDIPALFTTTARVKVAANDGELANQINIGGESGAFVIDTKDPIPAASPILIDGGSPKTKNSSGAVTLMLSATDDSSLEMIIANDPSFSGAAYEAFSPPSGTRAWTLTAGDEVKNVHVRFKDSKGNEVGPFSQSIILDTVAPQTPTGLSIQEVSNQSTGDVILFVSWGIIPIPRDKSGANDFANYKVWRSPAPGGLPEYDAEGLGHIGIVSDIGTNSLADLICNQTCIGTQYTYKVTSEDTIGNRSAASPPISATPTGTSPDINAPSIAGITVGPPGINYLPVTWTATEAPGDDLSNSVVAYDTTLTSDFSSAPTQADPTMIPTGGLHRVDLVGLNPAALYAYEVRSRDRSGNIGKASTTPNTFTFPDIDRSAPIITGVAVTPMPRSATFSWLTDEPSTSLVEYNGQIYGGFNFEISHIVVLPATLTPGTAYPYTIRSRDIIGNEATAGGSFTTVSLTDATPPALSNIVVTPSSNSAVITWDTAEPASSYVEYGSSVVGGKPVYNKVSGSREFIANHTITLPSNLLPSTTYFYRIRSQDGSANEIISEGDSFDTLAAGGSPDTTAPIISNVVIKGAGQNSVLISWDTNEPADSTVEYSEDTTSFNLSKKIPGFVAAHALEIAELKSGKLYKFQIKSKDSAGNQALANDGGVGFTFATLGSANPALSISSVQVNIVDGIATVSWSTSEDTYGFVEYGFDTSYGQAVGSVSPASLQSVTLPRDILGNVIYTFQIRARAPDGREMLSREVAVFTAPPSEATRIADDVTPPEIKQIVVPLVTHNSGVVSWVTNEAATTELSYGLTTSYGSFASTTPGLLSQSHSVTLTELAAGTTYYFRIGAQDARGNLATKSKDAGGADLKFTTLTLPKGDAELPPEEDKKAPTISEVKVSEITSKDALISWITDEESNSLVEYGEKSESYTLLAGDTSNFTLEHTTVLEKLTASTTYYFIATSFDRSGSKGVSAQFSFTTTGSPEEDALNELKKKIALEATEKQLELINELLGLASSTQDLVKNFLTELGLLDEEERDKVLEILFGQLTGPPRIISDIPEIEITDTSANISWETSRDTTSLVAYASQKLYKEEADDPYTAEAGDREEFLRHHSVTLSDLEPATVYHYQLRGEEKSGKKAVSIDRTFKTKPAQVKFESLRVTEVKEEKVKIVWSTSLPAEGIVEFTNTSTGEKKSQGDPQFKKKHEVELLGLAPKTAYKAFVHAKTEEGNSITSNAFSFTTGVDKAAPVVLQVRTKLSLVPGKSESVQAVISWTTDEPADGQVFYDEGFTKNEILRYSSLLQPDLTTYHVVILSKLRPGTVYRFQAVSRDASGNDGSSQEFKIITPKKEESVLELIIKNFEETFGFLKQLSE